MNTRRNLLLIVGISLLTSLSGRAQQAQDVTVSQLKDQIKTLAAIDRDETMPREVRELNKGFVRERRAQLRVLLQRNLDGLRKYLGTVGSSLSTEEKQVVQKQIEQTERDLDSLNRETNDSSAGESSARATRPSDPSSSAPGPSSSAISGSLNQNGDGDGGSTAGSPSSGSPRAAMPGSAVGQGTGQPSTSLNATLNARIRAKARIDQTDNTKQTETPSLSANSTSLVDQSSASDLIGVAANLAGLTAISNNNQQDPSSVSVTASAYALLAALNRVDPLNPVFYDEHRAWRNFSITLGYDDQDLAGGTKQRDKLFGAKYMFINRRDPGLDRNRVYVDTVTNSLARAAAAFGNLSIRARAFVFTIESVRENLIAPGFKKFLERQRPEAELALERARNSLANATTDSDRQRAQAQVEQQEATISRIDRMLANPADSRLFVFGTNSLPTGTWTREELQYQTEFLNDYLGQNYREKLGKEAADSVDGFIDQQLNAAELVVFKNLDGDARRAVEEIRRAPQLSVSFLTKQRRIGLDEYMGQLIFDYGVANRVNLSLNGAFNYRDSKVIGGDTRGFTFAGQLQFQLNRENLLGKKPFLLDVSTQGNWMTGTSAIYKAQGKITIPIADGIDFPVSVTYANRTEFINEHTVRGQFGFSVDTARLIRAFIFR